MADGSAAVDAFLDVLDHPRLAAVRRLRAILIEGVPGLTEHVKWNAPSFVSAGVDRLTFRLRPGDVLQLIFHRGPSVRDDAHEFSFEDPTGLLAWQTPDRAVLTFGDLADVEEKAQDVVALARRWVLA